MHPHLIKIRMNRRGGEQRGGIVEVDIMRDEERVMSEQGVVLIDTVSFVNPNIEEGVKEGDAVF
jgi:hypothetical protein